MKESTLKLLSKEELIQIITSDPRWERRASMKVLKIVHDKIESILNKQIECDITTPEGHKKFFELEKEWKKWSDIQMNL